LNKENIWEPICKKLEKKFLEQRRDGYLFVENLKKKFEQRRDGYPFVENL
jgi:hypothetical protein